MVCYSSQEVTILRVAYRDYLFLDGHGMECAPLALVVSGECEDGYLPGRCQDVNTLLNPQKTSGAINYSAINLNTK